MPIKHQTDSFRTRGSVRYECDGDICDTSQGDLRKQAAQRVKDIRANGSRAFFEKQDGFYRVFRRDPIIVRAA